MQPIISRQNVRTYLKQSFNLNEKQLFDKEMVDGEMFTHVTCELLTEFTKSYYDAGRLTAIVPFSNKEISLTSPDFSNLNSIDDIMQMLSSTHKERMEAIQHHRVLYMQEQTLTTKEEQER